jgi:hypothetical protein
MLVLFVVAGVVRSSKRLVEYKKKKKRHTWLKTHTRLEPPFIVSGCIGGVGDAGGVRRRRRHRNVVVILRSVEGVGAGGDGLMVVSGLLLFVVYL